MSPIKKMCAWFLVSFDIQDCLDREKEENRWKEERKREIRWSAEKLLYCLCAMGFCAIPADQSNKHNKC